MVAARRRKAFDRRRARFTRRLSHSHLVDQRPPGSAPTLSTRRLEPRSRCVASFLQFVGSNKGGLNRAHHIVITDVSMKGSAGHHPGRLVMHSAQHQRSSSAA